MHKSTTDDIFGSVIEALLAGEIICQVTADSLYNYLQEPVQKEEVDRYLRRIGRVLHVTQDGTGYFSAYKDINHPFVKQQIKRQFSEVINDLEPMIRWLRLAISVEKTGAPIQPEDVFRVSDLLGAIENAPALVDELDHISRSGLFGNSSAGAKKQLDSIVRRLCDNGYLVSKGTSGLKYVATAKWARLYEMLQFISSHEQLENDEDTVIQSELLY